MGTAESASGKSWPEAMIAVDGPALDTLVLVREATVTTRDRRDNVTTLALTAAVAGLSAMGAISLTILGFAQATGAIVVVVAIIYFASVIAFGCRDAIERQRVFVIFLLFLGAAMFWSGFEQAGSSMNIYARDLTDRVFFGWEVPTTWLQSVNPVFIILLAPVIGMLWVRLGARNPSIPLKFGMGLVLLGVGFLVLAWGALYVPEGAAANPAVGVSMTWLVVTYFFHTVGELALSPVGLSSVTKLSPNRLVGQMMGTWFMGAALGNLVAGLFGFEKQPQLEFDAAERELVAMVAPELKGKAKGAKESLAGFLSAIVDNNASTPVAGTRLIST